MEKKLMLLLICMLFFSCTKKDDATQECSISYVDGTYKATANIRDDWGGTAEVEVVVNGGKIISCIFTSYGEDGKVKDVDYGKIDGVIKNMGLYKIAQNAVNQSNKYGELLVKCQDIEELDALSGATVSFGLFKDAVMQIIEKAKMPVDCNGKEEDCNKVRG